MMQACSYVNYNGVPIYTDTQNSGNNNYNKYLCK